MIINVNGGSVNFVSGNGSVIIQNGKVIKNDKEKMKDIDEKKIISAENIRNIKVESCSADLQVICVNKTSEIKAILSGSVNEDAKVYLKVEENDENLEITINSQDVTRVNNMKLCVFIPKKEYEKISLNSASGEISLSGDFYSDKIKVDTASGNISVLGRIHTARLNADLASGSVKVDKDVIADKIKVDCTSGNVDLRSTFSKCSVDCTSGNVNVDVNAKEDIEIKVDTVSGNTKINLENIGKLKLITDVMRGNVKDNFNKKGEFNALVKLSTMYGNIEIK